MGVRRRRKSGILSLEIGIKNEIFLEKPEVGILIPINWFNSCNDSFLLVWNSHCSRVRFTVIVSCSDELAVLSCPSCACRGGLRKSREDCSAVGLYCVTNMATNLQRFTLYYGGRGFVVWDCWTHTSWHAGNAAR